MYALRINSIIRLRLEWLSILGHKKNNYQLRKHIKRWDVCANLLALEFRVSDRFAIGTVACGLSFGSGIYTNVDTEAKYTVNKLDFSLNNASLHFRFYF